MTRSSGYFAAAADPDAPLHRLEVLAHEERERLLNAFNATGAPAPRDMLADMFERQATATAQAPALIAADHTLSYRELRARARSLAWRLIECGAGPERFVALFLNRSEELVVAVLATLMSGAAFLPLDPDGPPERLATMLADVGQRIGIETSVTDEPH